LIEAELAYAVMVFVPYSTLSGNSRDSSVTADIDKEVARGEKPRHDLRQPRSEERWRYTWTRGSAAATRRHRIPTGTA
jgi:hypothetical protein